MLPRDLRDLLNAAGVSATVRGDATVTGVSCDPRRVTPGDVFCCIPGARKDGHDFARAASGAGAAALLVERDLDSPLPQARVACVRDAMGPLAAEVYGHPSRSMRSAAVTGTNGKTSTTYLLESMATAAGVVPGVLGTVDYRVAGRELPEPHTLGTPEAPDLQRILARMRDAGAGLVVMEATSIALDMRRVDGTSFDVVAFTNLTPDHIDEYHGSMEAYYEAKARLFDGSFAPRAVVNVDDAYGRRLAGSARVDVLTFSATGEPADLSARSIDMSADGIRASLRTPAGDIEIRTPLVGRYMVDNVLCAAGMALALGLDLDAIAGGVERLDRLPGRLERVEAGQPFLVLVDYAHTPDALEHAADAALELARARGGRLIVVFGCGGDRDRAKRPVMGEASTTRADLTILTSDNPRSEDPRAIIADIEQGAGRGGGPYRVEPDRREAIRDAAAAASAGDVVLIAGKGHETTQTFADRTVPFDDRVVAKQILEGVRA